jgi:hypothetical protein
MKVAIAGDFRVGKDYLADNLAKTFSLPKFSFADRLKEQVAEMYPEKKSEVYVSEKTQSIRDLFYQIGLDQQAKIPGYYTNYVKNQVKNQAVIPDLRFSEELSFIKRSNFVIVYLGEPVDSYDLLEVYSNADIRLPAKPNINVYNLGLVLKDIYETKIGAIQYV